MLMVVGKKAFQTISRLANFSGNEQFDAGSDAVAFLRSLSRRITMRAGTMSWMMRRRQTPAPRSADLLLKVLCHHLNHFQLELVMSVRRVTPACAMGSRISL